MYEETQYGFNWGALRIERMHSDKQTGAIYLGLTSDRRSLDLYVTRTGKMRLYDRRPSGVVEIDLTVLTAVRPPKTLPPGANAPEPEARVAITAWERTAHDAACALEIWTDPDVAKVLDHFGTVTPMAVGRHWRFVIDARFDWAEVLTWIARQWPTACRLSDELGGGVLAKIIRDATDPAVGP